MLYVIVGDGTGNQAEIEGSLADLMAKAVEAEQEFWFAIQSGDKDTTKYIVQWLKDNDVYFDSIGGKIAGAAEQRPADPEGLLAFIQEFQEDGVEVLALFVEPEDESSEDADLLAVLEPIMAEDVTVRLLNGQMTKISFADAEDEEVEEETTGPGAAAEEDEEAVEDEAIEFTEADLKKMTVPELTALAKGQGLDVKTIGKGKGDLIAAVLARQEEAEEGVSEDDVALDAALDKDSPRQTTTTTNGQNTALVVIVIDGEVRIKNVSRAAALAL